MNLTLPETDAYFGAVRTLGLKLSGSVTARLYVPTLSLERALPAAGPLQIQIGAQNAHWEKSGAFTGETSGPQLLAAGISRALIGHSERRQFFGETEATAARRALSLFDQGLHVLFCVGESRAEREAGDTFAVLEKQLTPLLPLASRLDPSRFEIAYEPVWAIGTGLTASPEQAEEAHAWIHAWNAKNLGARGAEIALLYGGSVTPQNLGDLLKKPNISGALVGGASLKPESFVALCQIALS